MARLTIRVRGVTYSSPDEAYVAAAELEDNAEHVSGNLRRSGKDADAETVSDRARADAARLRTWARDREAAEAGDTPQPDDTPKSSKPRRRASAPKSRAPRRRAPRASSSSGPRLTPRTRTVIRQTGIPAATSTASGLALQAAGLTLMVAFLTLLLTGRGVASFASLAAGTANGLHWIIDPVDPLAPRLKPVAAPPAGTQQTSATARQLTVVPLALGVG